MARRRKRKLLQMCERLPSTAPRAKQTEGGGAAVPPSRPRPPPPRLRARGGPREDAPPPPGPPPAAGPEKLRVLSLPSERLSVSGSAAVVAAVAQGLGPALAAVREERAALGASFCDLAVSPTSPAWRGEGDEEAKASSGVSAPRAGWGGGSELRAGLGGRPPKGAPRDGPRKELCPSWEAP